MLKYYFLLRIIPLGYPFSWTGCSTRTLHFLPIMNIELFSVCLQFFESYNFYCFHRQLIIHKNYEVFKAISETEVMITSVTGFAKLDIIATF